MAPIQGTRSLRLPTVWHRSVKHLAAVQNPALEAQHRSSPGQDTSDLYGPALQAPKHEFQASHGEAHADQLHARHQSERDHHAGGNDGEAANDDRRDSHARAASPRTTSDA